MNHDDEDNIPGWVLIGAAACLLIGLSLLTGCSSREGLNQQYTITVDEHTLPDGTRCAVAWSNGGTYGRAIPGGLSCDWHEPDVRLPTAAQAYITAEGELSWRQ